MVAQHALDHARRSGLAKRVGLSSDLHANRAGVIHETPTQALAGMDHAVGAIQQQQFEPAVAQVARTQASEAFDRDRGLQHTGETAIIEQWCRYRDQSLVAVNPRPVGIRDMRLAAVARHPEPVAIGSDRLAMRNQATVHTARDDDPAVGIGDQRAQHGRIRRQKAIQLLFLFPALPLHGIAIGEQLHARHFALQEFADGIRGQLRIAAEPQHQIIMVALPLVPQQGGAEQHRRQQGSQHKHLRQFLAQAPTWIANGSRHRTILTRPS